ncbi:hypothetical protein [uncultured Rhodospira sp.]|uniref:hypothetical protein n=1 Tax=uncultured Rhodospira sp. TaxID=1936189 RepID=UPI002627D8E3|nr:hypothetical protein [uncultured Rhodospira sp.]
MIKILIIVCGLVLVLGGGVGALTVFQVIPDVLGVRALMAGLMGQAPAPDTGEAQPPPPVVIGEEPQFMAFPQLAVPVISGGVARAHLVLGLRFHIHENARSEINSRMPELTDAYLTGLMREVPDLMGPDGRVDLPAVKAKVNGLTTRVLGPDVVHDVLIDIAYVR